MMSDTRTQSIPKHPIPIHLDILLHLAQKMISLHHIQNEMNVALGHKSLNRFIFSSSRHKLFNSSLYSTFRSDDELFPCYILHYKLPYNFILITLPQPWFFGACLLCLQSDPGKRRGRREIHFISENNFHNGKSEYSF